MPPVTVPSLDEARHHFRHRDMFSESAVSTRRKLVFVIQVFVSVPSVRLFHLCHRYFETLFTEVVA